MRLPIFALALVTLSSNFAAEEHDPATELASFTIAQGFNVNLFASETNGVIKPIQIRFDARGRLWVIGSSVYPQPEPGEVPNDKVLVLEDTNNDGICDKTTIFADGLMIPTGLELGDGGIYVGHGSELLFFQDTDGDLKADQRRVVLRGFGTGDNHQNINSFLFGPGGEMWFCQGLHTHSNVETPWGIVRMNQAGLWRFQPKLKKLEAFYGSVHEPQNPWGYVFTDWGEPIVIAGNNSSMIYPVPGLTSSHFSLPPHLIWKNGGGRKSSGADIVGTAHFPDDWQGVIITGGYINNAVWVLEMRDDGSGFALVDRDPLIKSSSRNFRPVDVKFGPDGSLYICDWYNPIIGHYQASFRHPDRDKNHGRIWRVTAKDRRLTKPPQLANASIEALIEHLKSNDRWTRQFAKRVLSERDSKDVGTAVEKWRAANPHASDRMLKELLGVLQSHEVINEQLLLQVSLSSDPGARAYAASAIGRWADRLQDPLGLLAPLATDQHPRVRLHTVVASSYIPKHESLNIAAKAAALPIDKFINYALKQTVHALKPRWFTAEALGQITIAADADLVNLMLRAGEAQMAAGSVREILNESKNYNEKLSVGRALIETGNARDFGVILSIANETLRRDLLVEMVQSVRNRSLPWDETLRPLISLVNTGEPDAIRLAGLWKLEQALNKIAAFALNPNGDVLTRVAAIEALGNWKDDSSKTVLLNIAHKSQDAIQLAAIRALTNIDLDAAARLAAASNLSVNYWEQMFASFLQRQGGGAALAKAFHQAPPTREIAAHGLQIMNDTGRRDEELASVLSPEHATKFSAEDIPQLVDEVRKAGNAERGAEIFKRPELGCVTCHAVKGLGGNIGPDLGALGTAQPVSFIIGAILEPQREVKEGYISITVSTKTGDEYQGYAIDENSTELRLRETLANQVVTIPKSQVQERRQSGSLMPAGLVDNLSRQELVDLIKYLSGLGE
ncbi:MAG TPA: PVC-type heme-binding CxxCH protein [Candidatus Kapabacteria bacterium]|nr:PVC-type heme-binding CxxCH protein [Candidatus Kapabacteria bacterium]